MQLQHNASQKAAQVMLRQQGLLASTQAQLDTARAAAADLQQQLHASKVQLAAAEARAEALEKQLAAERTAAAAALRKQSG